MKQYEAAPYIINAIPLVSESMEMVYRFNILIMIDNHYTETQTLHEWHSSTTCYSSEKATVIAALAYVAEHTSNTNANINKLRQSINSKEM